MRSLTKSFRIKMLMFVLLATLIPLLVLVYDFQSSTSELLTDNTVQSVHTSLVDLAQDTGRQLQITESALVLFQSNNALTATLSSPSQTSWWKLTAYNDFVQAAAAYRARIGISFPQSPVLSCYAWLPGQQLLFDSSFTYYSNFQPENVAFINLAQQQPHSVDNWHRLRSIDFYNIFGQKAGQDAWNAPSTYHGLSYVTWLHGDDGQPLALLSVNYAADYFDAALRRISGTSGGAIYVLDETGAPVYAPANEDTGEALLPAAQLLNRIDTENIPNGTYTHNTGGITDLVVYHFDAARRWTYLYILPVSRYLGPIRQSLQRFIIMAGLIVLLLLVVGLQIADTFYHPVKTLTASMEAVQNRNLATRISEVRQDEFQLVYNGFNNMVSELNRLIDDLVGERMLKRDSQIQLLQAQMNPHFIYNTLESIYSFACVKGQEEIASIVQSVSSFYRFSLSGGDSDITLKSAVEMTTHYLTIQNFRFDNKIAYSIHIPPALHQALVPKFILQAVVENSIYHGIEPMRGQGRLQISAETQNGVLTLRAADNGVGITAEKLQALQASIDKPFSRAAALSTKHRYALRSLNQQIKLHYGQIYGITLESGEEGGALTTITLPLNLLSSEGIA